MHQGENAPANLEDVQRAAEMFRVLSSPVRIHLIDLLATGERTVSSLVEATGQAQPLVSQHLRVLRENCLVEARRAGRESWYSLTDDHVLHIVRDAIAHTQEHAHEDDR